MRLFPKASKVLVKHCLFFLEGRFKVVFLCLAPLSGSWLEIETYLYPIASRFILWFIYITYRDPVVSEDRVV